MQHADTAMYECKRTGADHVVYDNALESLNNERLRLLSRDTIAEPLRNRIGDRLPEIFLGDRRAASSSSKNFSSRASASSNDSAAKSTS